MARYLYKLPDIGEGIAAAEIVKWHAHPGTRLAQDQPLVDVMTDKATVEITSPVPGLLLETRGREGERLAIGAVLAVFETERKATATADAPEPEQDHEPPEPPAPEACGRGGIAAPAVRARAARLKLDLASIPGSGPGGRVLHADLCRLLLDRGHGAAAAADDGVDIIRITGLRRRIAERMQESKRRIPHFTYVEEVTVEAVEQRRSDLNAAHPEAHVTLLAFIIEAMVRAIARHPEVNGYFDEAEGILRRHHAVHVGIATQTDGGLLVPVLRNAHDLSLTGIAAGIRRLSSAARSGQLKPDELSGSTITVTSLGALGGVMATPIINPPELAIVGVNRISERLILEGGKVRTLKVMNLSSSFDHRIIDGFVAASFIAALRQDLESGSVQDAIRTQPAR